MKDAPKKECSGAAFKTRGFIPRTSMEGSTLLAGIGSTESAGVRMNLCTAWEGELRTSLGEWLSLVSYSGRDFDC